MGKGNTQKRLAAKIPALIGEPIMLLNMSGKDKFCATSGRLLPKRGIAYRHNGELYLNRSFIPA